MMAGYCSSRHSATIEGARRYTVVPRGDGWSVSVNGACTRPFADKIAAERIAATLQRQADTLRAGDDRQLIPSRLQASPSALLERSGA